MFLLNASREFVKGDPKNYIPEEALIRIAETFTAWKEIDNYSGIIANEEIAKKDFDISPSRYIHAGEGDEYRPLAEIAQELRDLEDEAKTSSKKLRQILTALGV